MHAKVYTAGLPTGVDCQPEVTLPAGRLENLHRHNYHRENPQYNACNRLIGLFGH